MIKIWHTVCNFIFSRFDWKWLNRRIEYSSKISKESIVSSDRVEIKQTFSLDMDLSKASWFRKDLISSWSTSAFSLALKLKVENIIFISSVIFVYDKTTYKLDFINKQVFEVDISWACSTIYSEIINFREGQFLWIA